VMSSVVAVLCQRVPDVRGGGVVSAFQTSEVADVGSVVSERSVRRLAKYNPLRAVDLRLAACDDM